jgi:hypothetical protein
LVLPTFSASIDLDPQDDLDEDAFEEYFHLDPVTDPEEHEKRDEALKENEALINGTNEMFMNGQITWWDAVNEFADLPEDEFELEKTGAIDGSMYARGLLEPTEEERVDERSERYFDQFIKIFSFSELYVVFQKFCLKLYLYELVEKTPNSNLFSFKTTL